LICNPLSSVGFRPIGNCLTENDCKVIEAYDKQLTTTLEANLGDGQQALPARNVLKLSDDSRGFLFQMACEVEAQMRFGGKYYYAREVASKIIENTCRIAALYEIFVNSDPEYLSLGNAQHAYSAMMMFVDQYIRNVHLQTPSSQQI
jgi:hypothetical protein